MNKKCQGKTKKGNECKNYSLKGSDYCRHHLNQVTRLIPSETNLTNGQSSVAQAGRNVSTIYPQRSRETQPISLPTNQQTENRARCRDPKCDGAQELIVKSDKRLHCAKCNSIFYTNNHFTSEIKIGWTKYPQCFTNYDPSDVVCAKTCKKSKACRKFSPPRDKNYFKSDIKIEELDYVVCPTCGTRDKGTFCSHCGSLLDEQENGRNARKEIFKLFWHGWDDYFRTVWKSLLFPNEFFKGAFSKHSILFHSQNKTLPPDKFFILNTAVMSVVTTLVGWGLFGRYEESGIIETFIDVAITLVWLYIPVLILNYLLNFNLKKWRDQRKISDISIGKIDTKNTLYSFLYATPASILSIPFILLITEMLVRLDDFSYDLPNTSVFVGFAIIAYAGKFVTYGILLANALKYSSKLPFTVTQGASIQLMVLPQVITSFLRLCFLTSL